MINKSPKETAAETSPVQTSALEGEASTDTVPSSTADLTSDMMAGYALKSTANNNTNAPHTTETSDITQPQHLAKNTEDFEEISETIPELKFEVPKELKGHKEAPFDTAQITVKMIGAYGETYQIPPPASGNFKKISSVDLAPLPKRFAFQSTADTMGSDNLSFGRYTEFEKLSQNAKEQQHLAAKDFEQREIAELRAIESKVAMEEAEKKQIEIDKKAQLEADALKAELAAKEESQARKRAELEASLQQIKAEEEKIAKNRLEVKSEDGDGKLDLTIKPDSELELTQRQLSKTAEVETNKSEKIRKIVQNSKNKITANAVPPQPNEIVLSPTNEVHATSDDIEEVELQPKSRAATSRVKREVASATKDKPSTLLKAHDTAETSVVESRNIIRPNTASKTKQDSFKADRNIVPPPTEVAISKPNKIEIQNNQDATYSFTPVLQQRNIATVQGNNVPTKAEEYVYAKFGALLLLIGATTHGFLQFRKKRKVV